MSVSFADIRAMLAAAPAWTPSATEGFTKTIARLTDMGITLNASVQNGAGLLASAQSAAWPVLKHPRVALYACGYATDNEKTQAKLQDLAEGKDAALRLCTLVNADLRAYELDMTATEYDEAALAHALSYGLMAADDHVDLLVLGSVSASFSTALAAWAKDMGSDPLAALKTQDMAAILGAAIGAYQAKIPVLCDAALAGALKKALTVLLNNKADFIFTLETAETKNMPTALQALTALPVLKTALALMPSSSSNTVSLSQAA